MVKISITTNAFAAIASALPKGSAAVGHQEGEGCYLVTVDSHVLDRLKAMRRQGDSYSDVILRLARGSAGKTAAAAATGSPA